MGSEFPVLAGNPEPVNAYNNGHLFFIEESTTPSTIRTVIDPNRRLSKKEVACLSGLFSGE